MRVTLGRHRRVVRLCLLSTVWENRLHFLSRPRPDGPEGGKLRRQAGSAVLVKTQKTHLLGGWSFLLAWRAVKIGAHQEPWNLGTQQVKLRDNRRGVKPAMRTAQRHHGPVTSQHRKILLPLTVSRDAYKP